MKYVLDPNVLSRREKIRNPFAEGGGASKLRKTRVSNLISRLHKEKKLTVE